ncbi:DUF6265 family protein [Sphingosinicella sp. BN140058]|uniref:DUF6265 family protein n=1 Tax=Sphingosinicella sp. BN140058 TaxID=1892855 RepID=UPI0010128A01|nr:DUF6265 family protein [Sphingosinicella sp. BN140058]QAY75520.1 hypothetical protein ETR14_02520 [Sphingosinicella sp. BN140058]
MLLLALVIAAPTPDLGWLAGSWTAEDGSRWTQETWSAQRGGVLLGTGLSGNGEVAKSFEFMRIAPDAEGRLVFWGSPEGKAPVAFRWEAGAAGEAVFVNAAHDYPQRIAYRRDGPALIATISLADGSRAQSWRYTRDK